MYSAEIRQFHQFMLLAFSNKYNYEDIIEDYIFVFKEKISANDQELLKKLFNEAHNRSIKDLVDLCLKQTNNKKAFLIFCIISLKINEKLDDYINIPFDFFDSIQSITNNELIDTYVEYYIDSLRQHHQILLKEFIMEKYKSDVTFFKSIGIKKVFLFGSIANGDYNDYSDIDLVVDISNDKYTDAKHKIVEYNYNNFGRKSDIHIYNSFTIVNRHIKLIRIS